MLQNGIYISKDNKKVIAPFAYEKKYDDEGYIVTSSNSNDCSDEEGYIDYEGVNQNDTNNGINMTPYIKLSKQQQSAFEFVYQLELQHTEQNEIVVPKIRRGDNCTHCEKCGLRRLIWLDHPLEKKISTKTRIYARKTAGMCRLHFSRAKDEGKINERNNIFQTAQSLSWTEIVKKYQGKLPFDLSTINNFFARNNLKRCLNIKPNARKLFYDPNPGGKKKCAGCYEVLNWRTNANVAIKFSPNNPVCLYSKCVDCIAKDSRSNREKNKCSSQFIESLITLKADNIASHNKDITTKEARSIVLQAINSPVGPTTIRNTVLTEKQEVQLLESAIEKEIRCNYSDRVLHLEEYHEDSVSIDRIIFSNGKSLAYNHRHQKLVICSWFVNCLFGGMPLRERKLYIELIDKSLNNNDNNQVSTTMNILRSRWAAPFNHQQERGLCNWNKNQLIQFVEKNNNQCLVTTIKDGDCCLTIDRLLDEYEYNAKNCILLEYHLNVAKGCLGIFRNKKTFANYFDISDVNSINNELIKTYLKKFLFDFLNDIVNKYKYDGCNGIFT
ncbi:unnamed protein product [Cunninghamella echinulata]